MYHPQALRLAEALRNVLADQAAGRLVPGEQAAQIGSCGSFVDVPAARALEDEMSPEATKPPLIAIFLARSSTYIAVVLAALASGYLHFFQIHCKMHIPGHMCTCACMCRCAFVALDTEHGQPCTGAVLHHAKPSLVIWAELHAEGGAGPVQSANVPQDCTTVQIRDCAHGLVNAQHSMTRTLSFPRSPERSSGNISPVHQQLEELYAAWQLICQAKPELPFCYVTYTSGSTGKPAGVCGTEAGQPTS